MLAVAAIATVAMMPGTAHAQTGESAPQVSAKQQDLLDRFAPVMAIRKQHKECDGDERYRPMTRRLRCSAVTTSWCATRTTTS